MKKIKLTQGKEALVDDEDYETFSKYSWCFSSPTDGTAIRDVWHEDQKNNNKRKKRKTVRLHREIMKKHSELDNSHRQVNFINGDKLDCRKENLAYGRAMRIVIPKESHCVKCGETKPIQEFTFNSNPQISHIPHRVCKKCKIPRELLKEAKCTRCNEIKPIEKFGLKARETKLNGRIKYRNSRCIQCVTDHCREYKQDPLRGGRPEIKETEHAYKISEKRQKARLKRREKFAKELEHNIKNNIKLQCTKCKVWLPGTPEYWCRSRENRGGLDSRCKACKSQGDKKSYLKHRESRLASCKEYREDPTRGNRPELKAKRAAYRVEYEKRPTRKMRQRVSKHINLSLKRQGITKECKSIYDILGYTPHQLKEHLEGLWEPWMNWNNYGHGSGKWTIGHRIPQAALSYASLEDPYFMKAWSLSNLFPQEFIENIKAGSFYNGVRYLHDGPNVPLSTRRMDERA